MTTWLIAVIVVAAVVAVLLVIRFGFIARRLQKQAELIARSKVPTIFGTIAPDAIHQKVRIKRIRERPATVFTPGTRLGHSIRVPKMSFNFTTLFSRFRIDLDALDDVEAQYEDDFEIVPETTTPQDIAFVWWNVLFPCLRSKYKVGAENDDNSSIADDQSVDLKSNWLTVLNNKAADDVGSVHSGSVQVIDTVTGLSASSVINKPRKKKKKKLVKKPLTRKEQVDKFVQHMRQKTLRKQRKRLRSSVGTSDELDSLEKGSLESVSEVHTQEVEGEIDDDNAGIVDIVDIEDQDQEGVDDFPDLQFASSMETPMPNNRYVADPYGNILESPNSQYAGLTVGYHTTVSYPGQGSNAVGFGSSNGLFGWDRSEGGGGGGGGGQFGTTSAPRVNIDCAEYRIQKRAERKRQLFEITGERDAVATNAGPSPHLIPPGYAISGALLSMDHKFINYQKIMYLFDQEKDIAKGWFIGTLIGLSMIRPGNYHVRFEVLETRHKKLDGIYKLDLALEGINAYGRRWVILCPKLPSIDY